jgi:hypothetical protein
MRNSRAFITGLGFILLLVCAAVYGQAPAKTSLPTKAPAQSQPASAQAAAELTPGDVGAFLDGVMPAQLERGDIAGASSRRDMDTRTSTPRSRFPLTTLSSAQDRSQSSSLGPP